MYKTSKIRKFGVFEYVSKFNYTVILINEYMSATYINLSYLKISFSAKSVSLYDSLAFNSNSL